VSYRIVTSLAEVPVAAWNALNGEDNPFLRHEFLHALERTGCVGADGTGWLPRHLLCYDGDKLLGAAPLYLKHHSYGEYVFDWAWADAYARVGLCYYPKLVCAVPFTPATGPRLLAAPGTKHTAVARALIEGALAQAHSAGASSLHWLFTTEDDTRALEAAGFLRRVGVQFHWQNRGYRDFDDFLATFTADKRKKIKQERRYVRAAGVEMEVLTGAGITAGHCGRLYEFYTATVREHGAIAYLTRDFFHALIEAMPQHIVLVLARRGGRYLGGALNLRGASTLYGRYWGASERINGLHFETCYYTPIEYCIAHGLGRFEAGAQGEHKLARGLLPATTYSAHWLSHPQLFRTVADHLAREQAVIDDYREALGGHSPFKKSAI
jgi:predicted N-acyltransferase